MLIFTFLITLIVSIISLIFIYINEFDSYFQSFILIYMVLGFSLTIFALLYCFINRNKKMRLLSYIKKDSNVLYYREPPFSYSPVIVTYLENLKLEIDKDVFAELLFLSQKGYLQIQKVAPKKYMIIKNTTMCNNSNDLLQSQKFILSYINPEIDLQDLIDLMHKNKKKLENLYEDDCYTLGYLDKLTNILKNKKLERSLIILFFIPLVLLFICALFFFVSSFDFLFKAILFLALFYIVAILSFMPSFAIVFLIAIIFDRLILIRTKSAKEDYAKWLAFKDFLNEYTLIKNYDLDSIDLLEQYLTYAVALGITKIDLS